MTTRELKLEDFEELSRVVQNAIDALYLYDQKYGRSLVSDLHMTAERLDEDMAHLEMEISEEEFVQ